MELRDLKAFMDVVEYGSFTKAASESFVSQPSLSKSIKKLEDNLHVELLNQAHTTCRVNGCRTYCI
ncbi:HTH-type transcriptional regulator CynR [Lysinibacillus sphaericus]